MVELTKENIESSNLTPREIQVLSLRFLNEEGLVTPHIKRDEEEILEARRERIRKRFRSPEGRNKYLKRNYGITLEEYDEMFDEQNGVCAICGGISRDGKRLSVDHDHETGKVRELLCMNCNTALGMLQDNVQIVLAAAQYLTKHSK